jgi:ribosomal-protein-alanine N-acetyltransferase
MSYTSASIALHGPTLTVRLPEPADAPALFALASDPDVTRWFSWGPYTEVADASAYLERLPGQRERGEQLDLLIVHRDHGPAGITGLSEFSVRDGRAMVGTWFGRGFWGTGANRESKAMIAHLAFEVLGLHRLGSYSNPANERSTRALLGVGFLPRAYAEIRGPRSAVRSPEAPISSPQSAC